MCCVMCKLECRGLLGLLLATAGGGVGTGGAPKILDMPPALVVTTNQCACLRIAKPDETNRRLGRAYYCLHIHYEK
jgi:hypothetical protein